MIESRPSDQSDGPSLTLWCYALHNPPTLFNPTDPTYKPTRFGSLALSPIFFSIFYYLHALPPFDWTPRFHLLSFLHASLLFISHTFLSNLGLLFHNLLSFMCMFILCHLFYFFYRMEFRMYG